MAQRNDEENDYLESLFLKPFCQKIQEETFLNKVKNSSTNRNHNSKHHQPCNSYNFVLSQDIPIHIEKNHHQNRNSAINGLSNDEKKTPYQNRKTEQQLLSKRLRQNYNDKGLQKVLQKSQDSWLIIKQLQTKRKESTLIKQMNKAHKNEASLHIESITPMHRKKFSQSSMKRSIKTEVSVERNREEFKNIKSIMSYKNKKAIKQMNKLNRQSFDYANSNIEYSLDLKLQTPSKSKNTQKIEEIIKKVKQSYNSHRKVYMKVKNGKKSVNLSSDKIKIHINKSAHFDPFNIEARKLNGILRSSKMDMNQKQRPKTQARMAKSDYFCPSKLATTSKMANEISGWQSLYQQNSNFIEEIQ